MENTMTSKTPKTSNKMGNMSTLSQFSKVNQPKIAKSTAVAPDVTTPEASSTASEKLVTINIKILSDQHTWLTQTARQVRDNNGTPVAPSDRVFPQHLIGVAITLLQASDVDWNQVQTIDDLKQFLNL
jgi:hypothetical protein